MMFFGGWMIIFWVVIIGLIVWGAMALVRRGTSTSDTPQKCDPLDIAKERYAKGEISKWTLPKSATPKVRLAKKSLRKSGKTCPSRNEG